MNAKIAWGNIWHATDMEEFAASVRVGSMNFGLALFGLGTVLWWFNSQRYQDMILKKEAMKAERPDRRPTVMLSNLPRRRFQ
jgi:hypothetical protein